MIRQIIATPHVYYVLSDTQVRQYDVSTQRLLQSWDMPSIPCSELCVFKGEVDHWGMVCAHHLREGSMTVPHAFSFKVEDEREPEFMSLHEIGVSCKMEEKNGIRLIRKPIERPSAEVYQDGKDVCVRRRKQNGFMQRITDAMLLSENDAGILVIRFHTSIVSYDVHGLHPQVLGIWRDHYDAIAVRSCLLSRTVAVLANATSPGSILILDRRWHIFWYVKVILTLWFAYNVLHVLLSV